MMDATTDKTKELKREFSELPFESKVATLTQLEIVTVTEAFDVAATWAKKVFDSIVAEDCSPHHTEAEPAKPAAD